MRHVAETLEPDQFDQPDRFGRPCATRSSQCIPVAPPIQSVAGTRRVVALVGPTGVGKTTTVAKLAANFKLAHGVRVGLITVDTYRIAAVEQLKTYAEIIDLPLAVVNDPAEMPRALDELGAVDLVFIDTAGAARATRLRSASWPSSCSRPGPDEVHLVLSAVAGQRSLRSAVERFAMVQVDRLILTKLDEADSLGGRSGRAGPFQPPVSYLTTGQAVPDDIEPADRKRLARLILRQEDLCSRCGAILGQSVPSTDAMRSCTLRCSVRREEIRMSDQADKLRQLVGASRAAATATALAEDEPAAALRRPPDRRRIARRASLLFTSGKGGVGTSNLVLNLAIALGEMGQRVVVVDADIGLANLDLLCGLTPRVRSGRRAGGPLPAGRCARDGARRRSGSCRVPTPSGPVRTILDDGPARLVAELGELEAESDFVLVDAGSGLGPGATMLAAAADQAVIVSTPEPTSIADAHAAISRFRRLDGPPEATGRWSTRPRSASEAAEVLDRLVASSRQFQGAVVSPLGPGAVRADPHVPLAVRGRRPFLTAFPGHGRLARCPTPRPCPGQGTPSAGIAAGVPASSRPWPPAGHSRWWPADSETSHLVGNENVRVRAADGSIGRRIRSRRRAVSAE